MSYFKSIKLIDSTDAPFGVKQTAGAINTIIDDGSGSITVDGTVAVTDGGGSLTVDGTVAISTRYDYGLEVARGNIAGVSRVNKFGASPEGIQKTATDIWSRANSSATQPIWLAPTTARTHAIVSDSTKDSSADTGARTIRVYGLTTWATAETSEVITMNGTTPVNTANSYVIIHRMKVLTCGVDSINVGTITATAATDNTITALILPTDGQTEMAIYGVPSGYTFYLKRWGCGIDKASPTAVTVDFRLMVNENADVQTTAFLRKDDLSLQSTGSSIHERYYEIPPSFAGPCIIKVQGIGSANDIEGESGFDGYIVAN